MFHSKAGSVGGTEYVSLQEECIEPYASGVSVKSSAASAPPPQPPPAKHDQHHQPDVTNTQVPPPVLGPEAVHTTCPHCTAGIRTTVKYTVTSRTHLAAALCCLVCCCCCLPYCMDSSKNTDHYCPNCLKYIGSYEK